MRATKSDISNEESSDQISSSLSGHEGGSEFASPGDIYKHPKPIKRQRVNDIKHRKERSQAQERELARSYQRIGFPQARRVPGSGAIASLPGDVDVEDLLLVEAKESRRGTLTINPDWIGKIRYQARNAGKKWYCLHAWVAKETGNYEKVVVVGEDVWLNLIAQLKVLQEREDDTGNG